MKQTSLEQALYVKLVLMWTRVAKLLNVETPVFRSAETPLCPPEMCETGMLARREGVKYLLPGRG